MKISSALFATVVPFLLENTSAKVLSLTDDNYASETGGKTVFIKFFAPWCGHCKALAPDWEKLADEWNGHKVGLVAEVDCTASSSEGLCEQNSVEGYPTLMWGDPLALEQYEGGRDLKALKKFADENLSKAVCSIRSTENCDDDQKKLIADLTAKTKEELEELENKVLDGQKAAYKVLSDGLEDLNKQYQKMTDVYNAETEKLKTEHNFKWVTQILSERDPGRNKRDPEEDDDDDDDDDEAEAEL